MNAQTYAEDLASVVTNGVLIYDSSWPRAELEDRLDITVLPVPLSKMCNESFTGARARILMKNIAYVGAIAALIEIDRDIVRQLLSETFVDKPNLVDSNMQAFELGYDYSQAEFNCPLESRLVPMDAMTNHIMIDGNTAAALGCVYAGATVGSWYPITPSTSLFDAFGKFCKQLRQDLETGEQNYCIIQAEDELAAIGMALGAAWNGARAFTATSGPGVSLMSEFLGLAYFTEIPLVLFDVQRAGPSTGMPTRTQQSDILAAAFASHGDTRHVLLFPANPEECFRMAVSAFDLADRLQTPIIVMMDLDIGMNDWPCPELTWDDSYQPDRGKVYSAKELGNMDSFARYLDVDGDGICYRTLPGEHPKGAYLIRGSGHNKLGGYTENADEYVEVVDRLRRKFDTAAELVPEPVTETLNKSSCVIVTLGSCDGAVRETRSKLAADGVQTDYMRIRAFPFSKYVIKFLAGYSQVFVVEQNRDAQFCNLLQTEAGVSVDKLIPILSYGGMPIACEDIYGPILEKISQGKAA